MMCFPLKIIHLDVPLLNTSTFFIIVSCCCLYLCVDYFFFGHLGTFGFDVVDTEFLAMWMVFMMVPVVREPNLLAQKKIVSENDCNESLQTL